MRQEGEGGGPGGKPPWGGEHGQPNTARQQRPTQPTRTARPKRASGQHGPGGRGRRQGDRSYIIQARGNLIVLLFLFVCEAKFKGGQACQHALSKFKGGHACPFSGQGPQHGRGPTRHCHRGHANVQASTPMPVTSRCREHFGSVGNNERLGQK